MKIGLYRVLAYGKDLFFAVCQHTVKTFRDGAVFPSVLWTRVNFIYRVSFFTVCFLPSLPCAILCRVLFCFQNRVLFFTVCGTRQR